MNGWTWTVTHVVAYYVLTGLLMSALIDFWAWETGRWVDGTVSHVTQEFFALHPWMRWIVLATLFHLMWGRME